MLIAAVLGLRAGLRAWRRSTRSLVERLLDPPPVPRARVGWGDLDPLPDPVQRYFRAVLREGQPTIQAGRLEQAGQFLLEPLGGWRRFNATQHFRTSPPGFVWDADIRIAPGVGVRVRDGLVGGEGSTAARLGGVVTLLDVRDTPPIAAGALHRYLAEAVWFPTGLLPGGGVVWSPLDGSSARARLAVGDVEVSLDFHFDSEGLVRRVFTPERLRLVSGSAVPTPWQGRFEDYAERFGMRIPTRGEVEWLLPRGARPYWRGRITGVTYEMEPRGAAPALPAGPGARAPRGQTLAPSRGEPEVAGR